MASACILACAGLSASAAWAAPELTATDTASSSVAADDLGAALPETDPAHPRYRDCVPPENFSKRFPATTLDQAIKRSTGYITHDRPGPLASKNAVAGAMVDTNNVYVGKVFGIPVYGHRHGYTLIAQTLDGPKLYRMLVSSTNYSTISKNLILNDIAEIYVPIAGQVRALPLSDQSEQGFCSYAGEGKADNCFSTATASFALDAEQFAALANADPAMPIIVPAKNHDGKMLACPLYFSPLSFKAPLLMIDAQLAKAAKKRERQKAKGF
jgi:hypothetical protein